MEEDDYREILKLVAEMRRFQKEYFAHRRQDDLIESKRLEKLVDSKLIDAGI